MKPTTRRTTNTELARRAAVLTIFPAVIGTVQSFMQLTDGMPAAALPAAMLSVAIAALVFFVAVLLPSLALTRLKGEGFALQLKVICPACSRSQLIINTPVSYTHLTLPTILRV